MFIIAKALRLFGADLNLFFDPVHFFRLKALRKERTERLGGAEQSHRASKN